MSERDSRRPDVASGGCRRRARARRRAARRAVSDVIATILLLALTVVLFASIFFFVSSFPSPPAQNSNQFQAQIIPAANGTGTMALAISILHLAGPPVQPTAYIYLKSAVYPLAPEFASPYNFSQGGLSAHKVWNLGQTWYLSTNFTGTCGAAPSICHPILPDNITVYIIQSSTLLFSVVLPGTVLNQPPAYLAVGTTPASPAVGEAFTISAQITQLVSTNSVTISVAGLPLSVQPSTTPKMTYSNGVWVYNELAGNTTTSGTFYAFITATTTAGKTGTSAVPVVITKFSTLIANAFSLVSSPVTTALNYGLCSKTTTNTPEAACQGDATQEYYFNLSISSSSVTFGSVLFEVYTTATGAVYSSATHAVFAIATAASPKTPDLTWTGPTGGALLISSSWTATYGAGFSANSPLTNAYVISVDVGTTLPSATAGTLSFIVIGTGAYSGQTAAIPLPAS